MEVRQRLIAFQENDTKIYLIRDLFQPVGIVIHFIILANEQEKQVLVGPKGDIGMNLPPQDLNAPLEVPFSVH